MPRYVIRKLFTQTDSIGIGQFVTASGRIILNWISQTLNICGIVRIWPENAWLWHLIFRPPNVDSEIDMERVGVCVKIMMI